MECFIGKVCHICQTELKFKEEKKLTVHHTCPKCQHDYCTFKPEWDEWLRKFKERRGAVDGKCT